MSSESRVTIEFGVKGTENVSGGLRRMEGDTRKLNTALAETAKQFDAVGAARRQMEERSRGFQVRQAALGVDQGYYSSERQRVLGGLQEQRAREEADALAEARREAQRQRTRRLFMYGTAAFAASAVGNGLEAAGRGLNEIDASTSFAGGVGKVSLEFAKGLPILGQFVQGVEHFTDAAREATVVLRHQAESVAASGRMRAIVAGEIGINANARNTIGGAQRAADAARLEAAGGVNLALALGNPATLAAVTAERGGAELFARLQAEAQLPGARQLVQDTHWDERAAAMAAQQARRNREEGTTQLAIAQGALEEAKRGKSFTLSGAPDATRKQQLDLLGNEVKMRGDVLSGQLAAEQAAQNTLMQARERSQASLTMLAQKEYEARAAATDQLKAALAVMKEQEDRRKSGAAAFAMGGPMGQEQLLEAAKRFKEGGVAGLMPEELSILGANPLTAAALQQKAEAEGLNAPGYKQLQDLLNIRSNPIGPKAIEVLVEGVVNTQKLKQDLSEAIGGMLDDVKVQIRESAENQKAQLRLEQLQGNAARGQ